MTENEIRIINGKKIVLYREIETDLYRFSKDVVDMLLQAFEEAEQYRVIGTVEECLRNKDFLDFLSDKMNPNDFEIYLSMYNSSSEKQEGERWED